MKTKLTVVLALLLLFSMVLGGCKTTTTEPTAAPTGAATAKPTEAPTPEPTPRETLTLNYLSNANVPGIAKDMWWTKKLEEEVGVILNIISFTEETYNTALAANELPDVTYLTANDPHAVNAIAAGLLVNYDDYADLIPNVYAQYPEGALRYQRDKYGDGQFLYTIPDGPCTNAATDSYVEYSIRLAWDYFMEYVDANGQPELKELSDFLPVVKWMLDAHPTNADGQTNYGFTMFPSWDGGNFFVTSVIACEMWGWNYVLYPLLMNQNDLSYSLIWEEDGPYHQMMQFWFDVNQMGLFDPDAGTQTWDDYLAKAAAHRPMAYWAWGGSGQYYKEVPFENMKTSMYHGPWLLGNGNGNCGVWVSNCRGEDYITRSMEFINYMIDYDNAWYTCYGPQGEYWDLNAEGMPYLTELADQMGKDATLQLSEGGNPASQGPMGILGYWRFYNPQQIHPTYGTMFMTSGWALREGYEKAPEQASWEAWAKQYYNVDPVSGGLLSPSRFLEGVDAFAPQRISSPVKPDALKDFQTRMSNVYQSWWEMVYADDQAEFDSLWAATQATLEEMWEESGMDAAEIAALYTDVLAANEVYFD